MIQSNPSPLTRQNVFAGVKVGLDLLDLSHIIVTERVNGEPTFVRPDEDSLQAWTRSFSPGRLYTMGRLTRGDA
jgi:hypothetical protein